MAVITASVRVNGEPLPRAYVEHTGPLGLVSLGFTMTDANGAFSVDAGAWSDAADVTVHCQNSVVRVVNGDLANIGISLGTRIKHGDRINIPTSTADHFAILNQCLDVYDTVWRQFAPYNKSSRRAFPLGKRATHRQTFASNRRLELSYPDHFPSQLAFVEPAGLTNDNFPLTHIKIRGDDPRLFGDIYRRRNGRRTRADQSLLPHEMGHVFHFAALTESVRIQIEAGYVAFLISRIPTGIYTHDVEETTNPLVAYLEAIGMFSERFFAFRKRVQPNLTGNRLYNSFVEDELSATPSLSGVLRDDYIQVAVRNARGTIDPLIPTGASVEGSVYGALYLELASRIGLKSLVEGMLASNATNFDELAIYLQSTLRLGRAVSLTRANWNL